VSLVLLFTAPWHRQHPRTVHRLVADLRLWPLSGEYPVLGLKNAQASRSG